VFVMNPFWTHGPTLLKQGPRDVAKLTIRHYDLR